MLFVKLVIVLAILGMSILLLRPLKFLKATVHSRAETQYSPPRIVVVVAIFILSIVLVQGFGTVPTGHQGVILQWSAATGDMKAPGLYWVAPIRDSIDTINVQIQERTKNVEAASSDLQDVAATITVNYGVIATEAARLYIDVVKDYRTAIIDPAIEDVVKASTAKYTPEQMLQNRAVLRDTILTALQARLGEYFRVTNVSVSNLTFSAAYTQSIEDKVIAEQRALEAENKLRQVQFEAQQSIEQARAEAEKIRIQAEAIQAQGGSEYVALQMIQRWDGRFPTTLVTSGGDGPFQILDIGRAFGN